MNTHFMKKAVMLTAVVGTLILSSAFIAKEKKASADYKDFYIYVYFHDKNDYKTIYVSDAIHYEGEENCSQTYNWKPKVERAFRAYVESNYNATHDYTYMIGSTTGNYLSRQEASTALNEFIAEQNGKGNSVTHTSFNYYCE